MLKRVCTKFKRMFGSQKARLYPVSIRSQQKVIIFVHGLFGDPYKTWKKEGDYPSLPQLIQDDPDLQEYDVYSFGYQSNWRPFQYDFHDIARLLHSEIEAHLPGREIIFIVHSMGGIIVQQYIVDRIEDGNLSSIQRVKGILYLSVPFEGSVYGNLFSKLHKQVATLELFSRELNVLKEKWVRHFFRKGNDKLPANMRFFIPQLLLYGAQDRVVSQHSANPYHIDGEIFEVDEDHGSICKIDRTSTVYQHIKRFLTKNPGTCEKDTKAMVVWVHGWDKQSYTEDADIEFDWTSHFNITTSPRKLPSPETWNGQIIPQIEWASREWADKWVKQGGRVRVFAKCCLTGGILLGNRFSRTKGVNLEVQHYGEIWTTDQYEPSFRILQKQIVGNSHESSKAVMVLSVTKDIHEEVQQFLSSINECDYRVMINILPAKGAGQSSIETAAQAVSYAMAVKDIAEDLKKQGIKEISLFINAPFSVALFVGHRLTAVCPIQTYEYANPGYALSCRI